MAGGTSSSARGGDISAGEIAAMLNGRVEALAPELLREGARDGRFFVAGSIAGERGQSLKVNLNGARKGCWTDFSAAQGGDDYSGDMLSLVAVTLFGGRGKPQLASAIDWSKRWLGLDTRDPKAMAIVRREVAERQRTIDADALAETEGKRRSAAALWREAVPITGTPAQAYLAGRKIDTSPLGKLPGALRFHPAVWCAVRRAKHPAMIACIMGLGGELRGVHRTYLDVSAGKGGAVTVVKVARFDDGSTRIAWACHISKSHKMTIGPYQGGCIPLWKGACGKTLREIDPGTPVYVSEGIEDGLSVAIASPERRVVAAVAIANMGGLELPAQAGPLVLIGQNDPIDSKAVEAFERAIARQRGAGSRLDPPRKVQLMFPPPCFKDFNDLLMGKRMER